MEIITVAIRPDQMAAILPADLVRGATAVANPVPGATAAAHRAQAITIAPHKAQMTMIAPAAMIITAADDRRSGHSLFVIIR